MAWKIAWRFEEDEGDADAYADAIAACTDREKLRLCGYGWFEILGKLALDDYKGRAIIGDRLRLIEERRDALKEKPPTENGDSHV